MVSFEGFRAVDGVPIYLQIQTYIRRGCVAGTIRDGDELPSRRVLSALLGVNPNTVPIAAFRACSRACRLARRRLYRASRRSSLVIIEYSPFVQIQCRVPSNLRCPDT